MTFDKKMKIVLPAILFLFFMETLAQPSSKSEFKEMIIGLSWELGIMENPHARPTSFFNATVPGAVQLDYMKAHQMEHFSIGTNLDKYKHLEDVFYCYRTIFSKPELKENQNLVFYSLGIDYEFEILLNGNKLLHQEGMFTSVRIVLNDYLEKKNTLEVVVYPVPVAEGQPEGRRQAILAVKPPAPYGWDWHPRLVPLGIWDETNLKVEDKATILETDFSYVLDENLTSAEVSYSFETSYTAKGSLFEWKLLDKDKVVLKKTGTLSEPKQTLKVTVENPQLWWTYDHGKPHLYTSQLVLKDTKGKILDKKTVHVGFRKVELVMNAGAWKKPDDFPKSRSRPPFTLKLNNRFVFAKGSNWVHPEIFYGSITEERYLEQLQLVKEMNMNMIRVWGGGITNKEAFHEICDSLGIMVWQEFPLACNPYPDDPHYLKILEQEAVSIIKRIRQHPSLAMWSGGNELFNSWSGMTEQSHALRLLNSLCYRMDPNTPYIHTSPVYGVGHGHYLFYDLDDNLDVFQRMHKANNTAYTEFGMPSLAPVETLKEVIPADEQFPVKPTSSWVMHGGFKAWKSSSWIELESIERYFGKADDLEELVWQSQRLQAIGYKAVFEEARRQKPGCSMALNWCLNEPWPTAANNSIVAYPNIKKPSFESVKASLRPVLASAKFEQFTFFAGSQLEFDLWILNDTYAELNSGNVNVYLTIDGEEMKIGHWEFSVVSPNENLEGIRVRYHVPVTLQTQLAKISIEVVENPAWNSEYFVLLKSTGKNEVINENRLNF